MFIRAYLSDPERNASAAAEKAGYSGTGNSLATRGNELLKRPSIKAAVDAHNAKIVKRNGVTLDRVLDEYEKIAFQNTLDYTRIEGDMLVVDLSNLTRDQAAAIAEVVSEETTDSAGNVTRRTRLKFHDKGTALLNFGKHLGGFKNKTELTGPDGAPMQVDNRIIVKIVDSEQER